MRLFEVEAIGGGSATVIAHDKKEALELMTTYAREKAPGWKRLVVVREISLTKAHVAIDRLRQIS